MDLALSPDLEAYWCYLIVLSLALLVAAIQVRELLKTLANIWASAGAWLLLGAYTAVPVALFWLLDRADALHDTSAFAAILVAVTYRKILAGGSQGIAVPGGLVSAWQPFVAWSDKIAAGISARIARNKSRYDGKAIQQLASDPAFYDKIQKTVLNHSADPAKIQAALDEFNKWKPPLDDAGVLERKASYLYYALKSLPEVDSDRLFLDGGIIDKFDYYLYAREWSSKLFVLSVIAVLTVGIAFWVRSGMPLKEYEARYYLWRFQKVNATAADRFRAIQHLEKGLQQPDPKYREVVRQELTSRLRFELLPLETADRILKLLLHQSLLASDRLLDELADSLRTDNSDLRVRTQKELVYIGDQRGLPVPPELRGWKPGKEDALVCIDTVANTWVQIAKTKKAPEPRALDCLAALRPDAAKDPGGHK
jgi:hypothetical protein